MGGWVTLNMSNGLLKIRDSRPFLKKLNEPTSIRGLSVNTNEQTEGAYTIKYKDRLGVGGATVRIDLSALLKSSWWKLQPKEIREKIPNFFKK